MTKFATRNDLIERNRSRRSRSPRVSRVKSGFRVECGCVVVAALAVAGVGLSAGSTAGGNHQTTVEAARQILRQKGFAKP